MPIYKFMKVFMTILFNVQFRSWILPKYKMSECRISNIEYPMSNVELDPPHCGAHFRLQYWTFDIGYSVFRNPSVNMKFLNAEYRILNIQCPILKVELPNLEKPTSDFSIGYWTFKILY